MKSIIIIFVCCLLANLAIAETSGTVTEIKDDLGNNAGGKYKKAPRYYTIKFTGENIKDLHILLKDKSATVNYVSGFPCPPATSTDDIDVCLGSFTGGETFATTGSATYMSVYKSGSGISSGEIKIRINNGTIGKTRTVYFTGDGDADPTNSDDFALGGGSLWLPTLCSFDCDPEVPVLSLNGLVVLGTLLLGAMYVTARRLDRSTQA
jgi:hypothetical protein